MEIDELVSRGEGIISNADRKSPKVMIWKKDVRDFILKKYGRDYLKMLDQSNQIGQIARNDREATMFFQERISRSVELLKELKGVESQESPGEDKSINLSGDATKDAIIQYLYEEQSERPNRTVGWPKYSVIKNVRDKGFEESDLSFSFDYLEDEGYFKSTTSEKVKYYRLSSKALSHILPPSSYNRKNSSGGARVLNNGGIVIMGDNYGSVDLSTRTQLLDALESFDKKLFDSEANDISKIDARESIETIRSQLRRKVPDTLIIDAAWKSLQNVVPYDDFADAINSVSLQLEKLSS